MKCHSILNSTNRFWSNCICLSHINKRTFRLCLRVFSTLEIPRKQPAWCWPWPVLLTSADPFTVTAPQPDDPPPPPPQQSLSSFHKPRGFRVKTMPFQRQLPLGFDSPHSERWFSFLLPPTIQSKGEWTCVTKQKQNKVNHWVCVQGLGGKF